MNHTLKSKFCLMLKSIEFLTFDFWNDHYHVNTQHQGHPFPIRAIPLKNEGAGKTPCQLFNPYSKHDVSLINSHK